jgi:hypothetical protein
LQPLSGVGIVRGTRMTTSAITPPSARARATSWGVSFTVQAIWGLLTCCLLPQRRTMIIMQQ